MGDARDGNPISPYQIFNYYLCILLREASDISNLHVFNIIVDSIKLFERLLNAVRTPFLHRLPKREGTFFHRGSQIGCIRFNKERTYILNQV